MKLKDIDELVWGLHEISVVIAFDATLGVDEKKETTMQKTLSECFSRDKTFCSQQFEFS